MPWPSEESPAVPQCGLPIQQQQQQQQLPSPAELPPALQGPPPQQQQVNEPEGTFHPFKTQAYWFAGVDTPEKQSQLAAEWTAGGDMTHKVTQYHVGVDIAAAASPPPPPSATAALTTTVPLYAMIRDAPTVSSQLRNGKLSPAELAEQYEAKQYGSGGGGSQQTRRPRSAPRQSASASQQPQGQPQQLLAVSASGASLGSTLLGTLGTVGSGALQVVAPVHGRGAMRPSSASAAGGQRSAAAMAGGADAASFWGSGSAAAASRPAAGIPSYGSSSGCRSRPMSASAGRSLIAAPQQAEASFSAVAHSQGGPKMERLSRLMTQSDIVAVRALY